MTVFGLFLVATKTCLIHTNFTSKPCRIRHESDYKTYFANHMHNMKSTKQHNTSDLFVQTCDVGVIFIIVATIGMELDAQT